MNNSGWIFLDYFIAKLEYILEYIAIVFRVDFK